MWSDVDACQLTSVVQLDEGCSAVLIHPQLLLLPAHCRGPFKHAIAGDQALPIERCQSYPDGSLFGSDLAFCMLKAPAPDLAIIAPALGCELSAVAEGAAAWLVGFGATPSQAAGHKHISEGVVQRVDDEIAVAGPGFGACAGDSGGPLLIEVDDGSDAPGGALRVAGILSASSRKDCGESTAYVTPLWPFLSWLESESGFDLTACGDPDGAWKPGAQCLSYSRALLDAGSCDDAQSPFVSATCGPAADPAVQVDALQAAAPRRNTASCQTVLGRSQALLRPLLGVVLLALIRVLARRRC